MSKVTFIYANGRAFNKSGVSALTVGVLLKGDKKVVDYTATRIIRGDAAKAFVPSESPVTVDGVTTDYVHHVAGYIDGVYTIEVEEDFSIDIASSDLAYVVFPENRTGDAVGKAFRVLPVGRTKTKAMDFVDAFKLANLLD